MAMPYRDDRINQIWEGTNEINRQIITGYFMKKALMGEIPIRERIAERSAFLKSNEERNEKIKKVLVLTKNSFSENI